MRPLAAGLALGIVTCTATVVAVAHGWETPWRPQQRLTLNYQAAATIGSNGTLFVSQNMSSYARASHIAPDGTLLWSRIGTTYVDASEAEGLLPQSDGQLLIAGEYNGLRQIDANGTIVWQRSGSGRSNLTPNGGVILAECGQTSGLRMVTLRDRANGAVRWHHSADLLPGQGTCSVYKPVADEAGNVYVASALSTVYIDGKQWRRLAKFSNNGTLAWELTLDATPATQLVATPDVVYVLEEYGQTRGFRSSDGSLAWSRPVSSKSGWSIDNGDLIASVDGSLSRLDADTGTTKWSVSAEPVVARSLIAGRVVTLGIGGVARFDVDSGEVVSGTALPDAPHWPYTVGLLGDGSIGAVTTVGMDGDAPSTRLYRLDANSGALLSTVPLPDVPAVPDSGQSTVDPDGNAVSAMLVDDVKRETLRLRRVNTATGTELWQTTKQVITQGLPARLQGVVTTTDTVAAAFSTRSSAAYPADGAWVVAVDRASGAPLWTQAVVDNVAHRSTWTSDLIADNQGNFYFGMARDTRCDAGDIYFSCPKATIRKLDRYDGHEVWRREVAWANSPPLLAIVGSDLVTVGSFDNPADPNTLVGLSLLDGSPQWRTPALGTSGAWAVEKIDATHFFAKHSDDISRIATGTGQIEWTAAGDPTCSYCEVIGHAVLNNGSLLQGGRTSARTPFLDFVQGNGSVRLRLDLTANNPDLRGFVYGVVPEANGTALALFRLTGARSGAGLRAFASYDPVTNAIGGQQSISPYLFDGPASSSGFQPLRRIDASHLLVDTWHWVEGYDPVTAIALLDTTVTADGDLTVQLSTDHSAASPNRALPFRADVSYAGTAGISDVRLTVTLPPHTGVLDLSCNTPCNIDQRNGNPQVRFDLQPGVNFELSGRLRALPYTEAPSVLSAVAIGPIGLREPDTVNNFAQTSVVVGLFSDGFDGD